MIFERSILEFICNFFDFVNIPIISFLRSLSSSISSNLLLVETVTMALLIFLGGTCFV